MGICNGLHFPEAPHSKILGLFVAVFLILSCLCPWTSYRALLGLLPSSMGKREDGFYCARTSTQGVQDLFCRQVVIAVAVRERVA